jgi:hypothetical protein
MSRTGKRNCCKVNNQRFSSRAHLNRNKIINNSISTSIRSSFRIENDGNLNISPQETSNPSIIRTPTICFSNLNNNISTSLPCPPLTSTIPFTEFMAKFRKEQPRHNSSDLEDETISFLFNTQTQKIETHQ